MMLLLSATACSKAVPTVTTLLPAVSAPGSTADENAPSVNSGGGLMSGSNYKIFGKFGPRASVMNGSRHRIHMSGDN